MSLLIEGDRMTVVLNGEIIATATRDEDRWHVPSWPYLLDRNAAITALSIAERVITHGETDPCVREWRRELATS